jgi:hypothetical protein
VRALIIPGQGRKFWKVADTIGRAIVKKCPDYEKVALIALVVLEKIFALGRFSCVQKDAL